jgi:pimeloyl-ACP methyl ester carboxylesterase
MLVPKDIICIHGVADITGQWRRTSDFFRSHGFNVHFFEYPTLNNTLDIPAITGSLTRFISDAIGYSPYQIFAHSQGGLIAEWFDRIIGDANLKRIVTIGTPFQGNTLPLLLPKKILHNIPISRKQIEDLSCLSPVLGRLVEKRLEAAAGTTEYWALIGYASKILNIESDGAVSVCSANPNAEYYVRTGSSLKYAASTNAPKCCYVNINHLPVNMVRRLLSGNPNDPFTLTFLSILKGSSNVPVSDFKPSQCGFTFPADFQVALPRYLKKIISRPSLDGKYRIVYFEAANPEPLTLSDKGMIRLVPGRFTYILESSFFNTKTSAYS